jgi:hypothetical protein
VTPTTSNTKSESFQLPTVEMGFAIAFGLAFVDPMALHPEEHGGFVEVGRRVGAL